jgi:hypothetical protein
MTSIGAPDRMAKSMSSSLVAGQGASSSFDANSSVQYIAEKVILLPSLESANIKLFRIKKE